MQILYTMRHRQLIVRNSDKGISNMNINRRSKKARENHTSAQDSGELCLESQKSPLHRKQFAFFSARGGNLEREGSADVVVMS